MFDEFGMPIDSSNLSTGGDLTPSSDYGGASSTDFPSDQAAPGDSGGGFLPVQWGGMLGGAARSSGGGGLISRSIGAVTRRAGTIMTSSGFKMTTRKAWELTQKFGPEFVASALGMAAVDLVTILFHSGAMTRRHKRRGISSRDIRTTRRVVGFVNRMVHQIGCVHTPRVHARSIGRRARA